MASFKINESGEVYELTLIAESGEDLTDDFIINSGDFENRDGVYHVNEDDFEWLLEEAEEWQADNERLGFNNFDIYTDK